jgi:hypothetical protein
MVLSGTGCLRTRLLRVGAAYEWVAEVRLSSAMYASEHHARRYDTYHAQYKITLLTEREPLFRLTKT